MMEKKTGVSFSLDRLKVCPLAERDSLTTLNEILIKPDAPPPDCPKELRSVIAACARQIRAARKRGAGVLLLYGAHLLRNGAGLVLREMMAQAWLSHLATNGAGVIHDWEYSFLGQSTECVKSNVARGTFGTWDETGRNLHLALLAGGLQGLGFGQSLGDFIMRDGVDLPERDSLLAAIKSQPDDSLAPARADLAVAMKKHQLPAGPNLVSHPWKNASICGQASHFGVPFTVHPGIGYDIISNHPMFNGAVIGRAATVDFTRFCQTVDSLDHGVILSIGSAIMAPQVFEKSLSCVNNIRIQDHRPCLCDHSFYVVDLQDGGQWDWRRGEPPKDHPAYYLRFCKSFSRMGGVMHYLQCDNMVFLRRLYHELKSMARD